MKYKLPELTDSGRTEVEKVMITLGSKTKKLFANKLMEEFNNTKSVSRQMLTAGDVLRVAKLI